MNHNRAIEMSEMDEARRRPHDHKWKWSPDVLANYNDTTLRRDATRFAVDQLGMDEGSEDARDFVRAAFVARDHDVYYDVARGDDTYDPDRLDVGLSQEEKDAIRNEKDKLFNERGILMVNLAVSCAAILQGHVQSSINGASLYQSQLGIPDATILGVVNSVPFFTAAALGCWLALPLNDHLGRRGSMIVSAVLIFLSSLGAGLTILVPNDHKYERWRVLLGIRVVNGLGMGIKAVSTPILASETAIRFWRGSFLLAWQLWVAFGIMIGFVLNLIIVAAVYSAYGDDGRELTVALILGAPLVFATLMLAAVLGCSESPRYYMRGGQRSKKYNPTKAYEIFKELRSCRLLAMKDIYLLHKTIEQEIHETSDDTSRESNTLTKFGQLFTTRRLRNALISSSTVNLAQQLCGINVLAFYSGTFFASIGSGMGDPSYNQIKVAMLFSFGFGAVNFFFGLPAIKTIDTLGRRKLLTWTLPLMSFFMFAAAISFPIPVPVGEFDPNTVRLVALWLYFHAAVYSPGLGPIPFTLASESFPLSHREVGCAFAIAVNLGFAGLLTLGFPTVDKHLKKSGALGLFSGLTFVALVLVYLLVEETKELSLESLSHVLKGSKRRFVAYQLARVAWFTRRYGLGDRGLAPPELDSDVEVDPVDGNAFTAMPFTWIDGSPASRSVVDSGSVAPSSRPASSRDENERARR